MTMKTVYATKSDANGHARTKWQQKRKCSAWFCCRIYSIFWFFAQAKKTKSIFFQPSSSSSSVETYSKNLIIMFSSQYKLSWINSFETKWVWLSDSKVATLLGLFLNLICNQGNSTTVHTLTVLERRWF